MRNADFGMRNAECGFRNADFGVRNAEYGTEFYIPHSTFHIPHSAMGYRSNSLINCWIVGRAVSGARSNAFFAISNACALSPAAW